MAEFTGRQLISGYVGTSLSASAIDFGDHIVEFVTPTSAPHDEELREALAARGASIFAVTLPVRSLAEAEAALTERGAKASHVDGGPTSMLVTDPAQTGGALLRFRQ